MKGNPMETETKLPAAHFEGGDYSNRLIRGTILRCVDGHWSARDGTVVTADMQFLAIGTARALQRWQDGMPSDVIIKELGKPLPDVDELNAAIPQDTWDDGLDSRPRAPWQRVWVCYLISLRDGALFTFINSTAGAKIAVNQLDDRLQVMQTLRGAGVVPVVTLSSAPMKTQFGQKIRPDFKVVDFRELTSAGVQQTAPKQIGKPVPPVSTTEELGGNSIPFMGS
jgi:hypothetical protein